MSGTHSSGSGAEMPAPTATMRAVVVRELGGPEVLVPTTWPKPAPGPGQVRIRVGASAVAFGRDVEVRSGRHPFFPRVITLPHIFGGEHAGTVDAVGAGVRADLIGIRVAVAATVRCGECRHCAAGNPAGCLHRAAIGIHLQGSNAEFTVAPDANLEPIPDSMPFPVAAALAASGPLAHEQLTVANVGAGDWVAVPGASGAVGTILVALAARRGANVIALTRGRRAQSALMALGATAVLDTLDPHLTDALMSASGAGVDVVVDNVALVNLWSRYWPAVARGGRIVFAGYAGNDNQPLPVNVVELYNRRATLTGLTTGDPNAVAAFWAEMRAAPIDLSPDLLHAFALEDAAEAHARIERGEKVGHYVLDVLDTGKPASR